MRTIFLISIFASILITSNLNCIALDIKITEVLANPKGTDTGNEWIEIYNNETFEANLENWKIKNSSKEYIIKDFKIPAKSYEIIKNNEIKFTIKNSNEEITLLNPNNEEISKVEIDKSIEDKSYSLIKLQNKNHSTEIWSHETQSPREKNSTYYEIEGLITKDLNLSKNTFIEIDKTKIKITKDFELNTLKSLLKKGDSIKALIKIEKDELILKKIKLIKPKEIFTKNVKKNKSTYILLALVLIVFFILISKFIPKKQ